MDMKKLDNIDEICEIIFDKSFGPETSKLLENCLKMGKFRY